MKVLSCAARPSRAGPGGAVSLSPHTVSSELLLVHWGPQILCLNRSPSGGGISHTSGTSAVYSQLGLRVVVGSWRVSCCRHTDHSERRSPSREALGGSALKRVDSGSALPRPESHFHP